MKALEPYFRPYFRIGASVKRPKAVLATTLLSGYCLPLYTQHSDSPVHKFEQASYKMSRPLAQAANTSPFHQ